MLAPTSPGSELEVHLNGAPVPRDLQGDDLVTASGRSVLVLDRPRLYHLIQEQRYRGPLTVRLTPRSGGVAVYRIATSGCPRLG